METIPDTRWAPEEVIRGMANLSAFIETHPVLRLDKLSDVPFRVSVLAATDEAGRAEIDRIAAILGVTASYTSPARTHYEAVRHFGGGISYRATAITRAYMAGHSAWVSYAGSVQPEKAVAA